MYQVFLFFTFIFFSFFSIGQAGSLDKNKLKTHATLLLNECIHFNETAGLSAGISKDSKLLWKGAAGMMGNSKLANSEMKSRIASITKPMTAVAILQLHENQKLNISDPIQKYLPALLDADLGKITIKQLLNHTSGLQGYRSDAEAFNIQHFNSLDMAIDFFSYRKFISEPGKEYKYTTYGYVILGAIIERASGMTYNAYMKENIWDIAGMKNTGVEEVGVEYKNKSDLYIRLRNGVIAPSIKTDLSIKVPGGGLYSTVQDLLNFGNAILTGTLLRPSTMELMVKDNKVKSYGSPYGMGWFIYGDEDHKNGKIIGHSGSQSGASTQFMIFLDKKMVVAVLGNTADSHRRIMDLTDKLSDLGLDNPGAIHIEKEWDQSSMQQLEGNYVSDNGRIFRITEDDKKLFIQLGNSPPTRMYTSTDGKCFIRRGDIFFTFDQRDNGIPSSLTIHEWGNKNTYIRQQVKSSLAKEIELKIENGGETHAFDLYIHHDPDYYYVDINELNLIAKGQFDEGNYKKALKLYKHNYAYDDESLESLEGIASSLLQLGDKEGAREVFIKSASIRQDDSFYQLAINPPPPYSQTELPKDTMTLFKHRGDLNSNEAFVFVQGGPDSELQIDNRRDPFSNLPYAENYLRIYPFQSQMLNKTILSPNSILSKDQCAFEHQQSAEIIYRVVQKLKNEGKTVYLFGHSYGSKILIEYINSKNNNADKIVLAGTRLDTDMSHYVGVGPGQLVRWERGIKPFISNWYNRYPAKDLIKKDLDKIYQNTKLLVHTHNEKKITEVLSSKRLSNVVFVHAIFDEASGRLSSEESDFLNLKNATVLQSFGNHHSMLSANYMLNIIDFLRGKRSLKKSIASTIYTNYQNGQDDKFVFKIKNFSKSNVFMNFDENELITLGYEMIYDNKYNEALSIFSNVVELFPSSWNAYDSQGEIYYLLKDYESAKDNYLMSLKLNPQNNNAKDFLEKIENESKIETDSIGLIENQIKETLLNYLNGTKEGQPELLKIAFDPNAQLLSANGDEVKAISAEEYIGYFNNGRKRNRIGEIISIDYVNDAAIAKIKIDMPDKRRIYTDFLLLIRIESTWKIVSKSYTFQSY